MSWRTYMPFETEKIRNIALVGHGHSGKTSLNEAILFTSGRIKEMGKVDDGKSVSDYTELEIARKVSVKTSFASLEWQGNLINVLDTPGSPDFVGEVMSALSAAEITVFVINGEAGVEIETIKKWRRCKTQKMVYITKMAKDSASFSNSLDSLKENFKDSTFVPLTIPGGSGGSMTGVVDLVTKNILISEDNGKKVKKEAADDSVEGLEDFRTQLIEAAVETDEALMNKYFEGEALSDEEISKGVKAVLLDKSFVPVLCGDSHTNVGTVALLDAINRFGMSPAESGPCSAKDSNGGEIKLEKDSSKPVAGFIFKSQIDQFAGKISFIKVISGTLTNDMELYNPGTGQKERCGKLHKMFGKNLTDVTELKAGDIGALVKLAFTNTNDTLCDGSNEVIIDKIEFPQPVYTQAISCPNKKDEEKMIGLLQKAAEEDPTFIIKFVKETRQNQISGMGVLHIKLILDTIKEKNKIETILEDPRIAFRETIRSKAQAEYTHKKQSGGHGQYGKVAIEVYPIEEGKQYEFVNAIVGGVISKGYIPGCEKGFQEAMENGVLAGYHVVDIGIKLFDGKEHPVDSSEMSFKIASRNAFKEAMQKAKPTLLEPVMELSVFVGQQYVGDILSDLSTKRGRVTGQDSLGGGIELIKAYVPQMELIRYSIDLKSITSGTGSFEVQFDSYQPLSGKLAEDVIKASKAEEE
jgi:elongation factor G